MRVLYPKADSVTRTLSVAAKEYNGKSGSVNTKLEAIFSLCRILALKMPFRCVRRWNAPFIIYPQAIFNAVLYNSTHPC